MKNYSANAFQYWRGIDSANETCVGFMALLQEVVVPRRIQQHPLFSKLACLPGMAGWVIDVLGIRKTWNPIEIVSWGIFF